MRVNGWTRDGGGCDGDVQAHRRGEKVWPQGIYLYGIRLEHLSLSGNAGNVGILLDQQVVM